MILRRAARQVLERVESVFDVVFTPAYNPLYYLGALGWFFYWIVIASGIYLYIFFDTGVTQAYESVEQLTHAQWYAGGIMRSLHRYASDALVLVMIVHLLREYLLDRLRGARWFAWVVGVAILWLVFASGISGYWVVWDRLAQYVAIATSEWLDTLGLFGEPIARNFAHDTTLSGRFFTLMVFIHIAVPLLLLFVLWIHIIRHAHPKVNPPRALAIGSLLTMLALSIASPALSQGPADLNTVPARVGLDWFYLALYPLLDRYSGLAVWAIVGVATFLLVLLPWLPPLRRPAVARVDLSNCNGCGRCAVDCPYSAISMEPRSDQTSFSREAVVDAARCVSCGVCVGSCPTATPYRRRTPLSPGIDLPDADLKTVREQTMAVTQSLHGDGRVLVYGCEHGADLNRHSSDRVGIVTLPCVANLPPAFLDLVISRKLADGVMLTGCRGGDCHYRLGITWTEQRIARERDPMLRERVPRERIEACWAGVDRGRQLSAALMSFQERLEQMGPFERERARRAPVEKEAAPSG